MHILDMDVNNRISKQAFADAYEAATHGANDCKLYNQSIASANFFGPKSLISLKSVNTIVPIDDSEQEGQKKSATPVSVSKHLLSLRQTLEQQNNRIAEFQLEQSNRITEFVEQHRRSMMQLEEVMKDLAS